MDHTIYLVAAYVVVLGGLAGYGIWRGTQLAGLRRDAAALRAKQQRPRA